MTKPETYTLTFQAADNDSPPVDVRVRRLLKCALRSFGLKCVRLDEPPNPNREKWREVFKAAVSGGQHDDGNKASGQGESGVTT